MELNYKSFGSGFPLVILHGLFGSLDNWQTLAKQFALKYSVFIVDLRNHGRSPHSDEQITYSLMASDLERFLDSHHLNRVHLVGHSMGGKVAMQFGLDHPDRVEKLVVADMSTLRYGPHHSEVFRAMEKLDLNNLKTRNEADEILATDLPEYAVRQFLLKNLERNPMGGYDWKFNLEIIRRDYDHILDAVSGPAWDGDVLFLRGGKSPYIKDEMINEINKLFPRAQVRTIEGAGHWIHAEKPVEFLNETMAFLNNDA